MANFLPDYVAEMVEGIDARAVTAEAEWARRVDEWDARHEEADRD